jgi:hypothetical protein
MAKYHSHTILSFSVLIDGRRKRVAFSPLTNGGSAYTAKDEKEAAILEGLDSFGKTFVRTDAEEKTVKPKKTVKPAVVAAPDITSWQEAVKYLEAGYGFKKVRLNTPDKILAVAAECGVSFPNITGGYD